MLTPYLGRYWRNQKFIITENPQTKNESYWPLSLNSIIKCGLFGAVMEDCFQKIGEEYSFFEKEYLRLKSNKTRTIKQKTEAFASVRTRWLRIVDVVRTGFREVEEL